MQPPSSPAKKRIPRWLVAIAAVAIACFLLLFCAGGIFMAVTFSALSSATTEADFTTDVQRIQHLNSVLPINIPANASSVRFTHQGFQDEHIDAEFTIPANEIDLFVQGLPPLDQPQPDHYEGAVGFTPIQIEVDRSTGRVRLVWFET